MIPDSGLFYEHQVKGLSNTGFRVLKSPLAFHSEGATRSGSMAGKKLLSYRLVETTATEESLDASRQGEILK